MAKMYTNQNTHLIVASGEITEVAADRMSFKLKTQSYDRATKESHETVIEWKCATALADDIAPGKRAAVCGMENTDLFNPANNGYQAGYVSAGNGFFDFKDLAVVNGDVVFARYNEEKNEDGSPKMTKERTGADGALIPAKAKKPHFDIGISTEETNEAGEKIRVLHTTKCYAFKGDTSQIDRYKKLFANFDRESNPVYATIVTAPGVADSRVVERDGKTYTNHYAGHMGIKSLDVEYTKVREKEQAPAAKEEAKPEAEAPAADNTPVANTAAQAQPVQEAAPAAPAAPVAPVATGNGLEATIPASENDEEIFI